MTIEIMKTYSMSKIKTLVQQSNRFTCNFVVDFEQTIAHLDHI